MQPKHPTPSPAPAHSNPPPSFWKTELYIWKSRRSINQLRKPDLSLKSFKRKNPKKKLKKKRKKNWHISRSLESFGSVMESQREAQSMLASFLTFQFLCNNRSSHDNFFASFKTDPRTKTNSFCTRSFLGVWYFDLWFFAKWKMASRE